MKTAIYTRVSSDDQIKGTSLDVQAKRCAEDAERNGWTVIGVFSDEGVSATATPEDRPGFAAALAARPDIIIAQDQDRLVRDEIHVRRLQDLTVRILSLDGFDSQSGDIGSSYRAVAARYEREKILLRTTRARLERASEGRYVCGRPPLGYLQNSEEIVQDETEVAMVREMAAQYLSSHDTKHVAAQLNDNGYLTRAGNQWDADGVRRVLRNEALLGTFTWKFPGARILGETFPAQTFTYSYEPVLATTTFLEVTRLFAKSNRGKYRSGRTRYPLSGHIFGACDRPMSGAEFNDSVGRRYRCDSQDKETCSCRKQSIAASKVENAVATWITLKLISPEVVEELLREHRARQTDAVKAEREAANLRKRESELMRKQEDVFLRFEGEAADRILARVETELASVRERLVALEETVALVDFTADDLAQAIEAVVGDGTRRADLRDNADLRRLMRALDVRVDLVEREAGRSIKVSGRVRIPELNASCGA